MRITVIKNLELNKNGRRRRPINFKKTFKKKNHLKLFKALSNIISKSKYKKITARMFFEKDKTKYDFELEKVEEEGNFL